MMTRGRSLEGEGRARSRSTSGSGTGSGQSSGSGTNGSSSTTQSQTQPAPDSGSTGNTPTTTTTTPTTTTTSNNSTRPSPRSNTVTELYRSICNSRTRSRSRHSHRHHRRRHSWFRCKRRESNFPAAICNMLVLVLLCSAMAEPQWFYMRGGGCREHEGMPVHYIGISKFFPVGQFLPSSSTGAQDDKIHTVYNYGSETLENCVSPGSVEIIRSIIALCFVAIVFSLVAFLLDLAGPSGSIYRILHRNAVFSILTVITCVTINGFSYWVASRLEHLQHATKLHKGSRVEVQFSISFYLVSTAGAVAVVATACNLLRRYPPQTHHDDRQQLVSDSNDIDGGDGAMFGPENDDVLSSVAPPPPYTP